MYGQTMNDTPTLTGGENPLLAGRYQVVRQLGSGGMGSVWLAEDTQLDNKLFAIKMLPSILVANKRAYRQLKNEALVAMRLVHPNIMQIRAFEENNGNPFLVMDYIEGQTLDDYLAEKGKLSEDETIKLLKPVAVALDYAHGEGVIHRDIKPANVMIRKDGRPFILDFGIAREIQETMTRVTGQFSSGTLMYMSPEQNNGDEPTSAQDIYSFAVMAYECLTGAPPFTRGNIEDQIKNKLPAPLPNGIAIASMVMSGLAKSPDARPKNCVQFFASDDGRFGRMETAVQNDDSGGLSLRSARRTGNSFADEPSGPKIGDVKTITLPGGATMEMIYCAPGEFMMGSPENETGHCEDEAQHRVKLTKGFWLGKFPVTQDQWFSVMRKIPSKFKGDGRLPVEHVSWDMCKEFIDAVLPSVWQQLGCEARFPTEAEWEYACRAGTTTAYSWGDSFDGDKANCDGKWQYGMKGKVPCSGGTSPVGSYGANAWGFYDMHGNVFEWCADWYGDYNGDAVDPTGQVSGSERVLRGGDLESGDWGGCRSASRIYLGPSKVEDNGGSDLVRYCGFRLCCSSGRAERARLEATEKARRMAEEKACREAEEKSRHMAHLRTGEIKSLVLPGGATMEMIYCAPGEFTMGSPECEDGRWDNEVQHQVKLTKGFWLGKFPVTQAQWQSVMGSNPSDFKGNDNLPVDSVSWDMCMEFVNKVTASAKQQLRCEAKLPTEAEWEYACRAGTTTAFFWGNSLNGDRANCKGTRPYGTVEAGPFLAKTTPVGNYCANAWGFYDMHGNVWEWCADRPEDYCGAVVDPQGAIGGEECRVYRGGSWARGAEDCRSAYRRWCRPICHLRDMGFRLCCS